MQGRISTQSTLFVTDYRCLDHADFINGQHLVHRIKQREMQPENSDRLRMLVDKQKGVFTRSKEFVENKYSSLVLQDASSTSKFVDILKVHDFNYIQKVISNVQRLQGTGNKRIETLDQNDTAISEMTW